MDFSENDKNKNKLIEWSCCYLFMTMGMMILMIVCSDKMKNREEKKNESLVYGRLSDSHIV